jgi:hypothetical protein
MATGLRLAGLAAERAADVRIDYPLTSDFPGTRAHAY